MSKIADALAWLAEDKSRGYRKASKLFGIPASDIKRARLEQRSSSLAAGPISRLEFEAWLSSNPAGRPMDCIRALRPDEEHEAGGAEYDRVWRYQQKTDSVEAPKEPRAPAPREEPLQALLERREWAVLALQDVEQDIWNERNKRNTSANGLSSLLRAARELRDIVDRSATPIADELDTMTAEEQDEWLRLQADTWSDAHLEVILRVYADRLNVQLISVFEGRRSSLTDEGWTQIG